MGKPVKTRMQPKNALKVEPWNGLPQAESYGKKLERL